MTNSIFNWEELLEIEDFTHDDLSKSIDNMIEKNNEPKGKAIKNLAKEFDFGEKIDSDEIEELLNNIGIIEENKEFKFPQANNISVAIIALDIMINDFKPTSDGKTYKEIADLLGFTPRQGNYYGDFLVYLGFLEKIEKKYYPTELSMNYKKQESRKEKNKLIIKSMIKHETIRTYFLLFHTTIYSNKGKLKDKLFDILKEDPLLEGFEDSTIKRRSSTVDAMAKWTNKVVKTHPKPFVKWAGGKQRLLESLTKYLPEQESYSNYIEPFAGGAALFYYLKPKNSILNDYNEELINAYQQIKTNVTSLIKELDELENNEEQFYEIRNIDRDPIKYSRLNDVERAARFIYLNKTCFNGLYRVNKNGEFNTPYGHNPNSMFKIFELLTGNSKLYNNLNVQFFYGDYNKALEYANKNSFVYLDPPYDPISKTSNFTSYTNSKFDKDEQIRLKTAIDNLHRKGVKIMLSNSDTEFIRDLYSNESYNIYTIEVHRNIASKKESRKVVSEVIITNY